jgi:hypothetical protein
MSRHLFGAATVGAGPGISRAICHHPMVRLAVFTALLGTACHSGPSDPIEGHIPTMPHPMPGQASLGGHVRDANGQGVPGVALTIAETDGTATSDATGAFTLMVPSDSTLTLTATATGMARTFRESVVIASGSVVSDFDVLLLPTAAMAAINTLGPAGQAATRGAVAVRLHSMSAGCVTTGALVTVFPATAATVLYSAPATTAGSLDMPDATLKAVQPGTQTAAWLVDALPPGNMNLLRIDVQKAGCQLMPQSPSLGGLMFLGQREVAVASLTEADLFLQ